MQKLHFCINLAWIGVRARGRDAVEQERQRDERARAEHVQHVQREDLAEAELRALLLRHGRARVSHPGPGVSEASIAA